MTLPLRVPNLGLSWLALVVRTMSTTGVPRRQMVTGSPSSTALISSGSLFLASATLTFMNFIMAIYNGYVKADGQTDLGRILDLKTQRAQLLLILSSAYAA